MINLLPPDIKQDYHYARRNVGLRRWIVILVIAIIGLGGITTFGLLKLQQKTVHYNQQNAIIQGNIKKLSSTNVQKQAQDMSNTFKLVVKVLSNEVLFSELLKQISKTIPNNANLTGLTIADTKGGIDITAVATDYATATQVQVNLADPANKIFSKADIIAINCTKTATTNTAYPCTVTIRALFAADNPFLFINTKPVKK